MVKYNYEYVINNKNDNDLTSNIHFFTNISFIGIHKVEQMKDTLHIYVSIPNTAVNIEKSNHFSRKLPLLTEKVNTFYVHSTNELKVHLIENKHYKRSNTYTNKYVFAIYATNNTYPKWEREDIQEAAKKLISYDDRHRSRSREPVRSHRSRSREPERRYRSRSREPERRYRSRSRERDYEYDRYIDSYKKRERDYEDSRDKKRYRSRSRETKREDKPNVHVQPVQNGYQVPPIVPFPYGVPYESFVPYGQYGYYGHPVGPLGPLGPLGPHGLHVQQGPPGPPGHPGQHGHPQGPPLPPGTHFSYGNM
jgi:hypothetical protein